MLEDLLLKRMDQLNRRNLLNSDDYNQFSADVEWVLVKRIEWIAELATWSEFNIWRSERYDTYDVQFIRRLKTNANSNKDTGTHGFTVAKKSVNEFGNVIEQARPLMGRAELAIIQSIHKILNYDLQRVRPVSYVEQVAVKMTEKLIKRKDELAKIASEAFKQPAKDQTTMQNPNPVKSVRNRRFSLDSATGHLSSVKQTCKAETLNGLQQISSANMIQTRGKSRLSIDVMTANTPLLPLQDSAKSACFNSAPETLEVTSIPEETAERDKDASSEQKKQKIENTEFQSTSTPRPQRSNVRRSYQEFVSSRSIASNGEKRPTRHLNVKTFIFFFYTVIFKRFRQFIDKSVKFKKVN